VYGRRQRGADGWANIAAEEPDTHGVEWLNDSNRTEVRRCPSHDPGLANLKREISEKKGVEARPWAGGRTSKTKYQMPKSQRPDSTVAGSTKRLASRFYQIKTGHCLSAQCLNWTKDRPTSQCWWCLAILVVPCKMCPEWKAQQKILWAEVRKETGRWRYRWKIQDLLADERYGRAVLDFLSTTDVGRRVPAEEDAVGEVSEEELRGWGWGGGGGTGSGGRGAGRWGVTAVPSHARIHGVRRRGLGGFICLFSFSFPFSFPLSYLWCATHFLGTGLAAWAEGKVELATCRHRADSGQETDCT